MSTDVDRLLNGIPIESFIQRYVPLKKKGNNLWGLCPFHSENTPSFSVSPEKGIFKCFGCGKGGNLLSFVQYYENIDFVESLKLLSEYSGITLEKYDRKEQSGVKKHKDVLIDLHTEVIQIYREFIKNPDPWEYLTNRGVTPESVEYFQLGYAPPDYRFLETRLLRSNNADEVSGMQKALIELGLLGKNPEGDVYNRFRDRLIFPIRDSRGHFVAVGGRIIRETPNAGKYVNSPESPIFSKKNNLYNLYESREAIRKAGQAILVEGYLDVIGLHQAGVENCVAPLGTAFTPEQARLLKRYTDTVIIFLDADGAGIEASMKSLITARSQKLAVRVVVHNDAKTDPFDLSQKLSFVELLALLDGARSELAFVLWYFFTSKYSMTKLDEKRKAIEEFFAYLDSLETSWEKNEHLKEAAIRLSLDPDILITDYRSVASGKKPVRKMDNENKAPKIEETSRLEKEILALLLRFPGFWKKEALLEELSLTHKEIYLLFTFFRDRLRAGEFWKWDELSQVISLLPDELGGLLSGIILEMDEVFLNNTQDGEPEADLENRHYSKLESLVFLHKRERLVVLINKKQKELASAETLEENVDQLSEELTELFAKKHKIDIFLASK